MSQSMLSVRVDSEEKKEFERFCDEVGINVSTAINMFIKKVLMDYEIPFQVSAPKPNAETIEAIKEVQQMKENPDMGKSYEDVDAMIKKL